MPHLCIVGGKVGSVGDDDIHRAGIQSDRVDQVSIAAQLAGRGTAELPQRRRFFSATSSANCFAPFARGSFVGGEAQLQGDSRAGSGSGRTGGSCSRGSGSSSAGAGAAAGSQTQSSSGNASHLPGSHDGKSSFHKNSPSKKYLLLSRSRAPALVFLNGAFLFQRLFQLGCTKAGGLLRTTLPNLSAIYCSQ